MDSDYRAHVKDLAFAFIVTIAVGVIGDLWYTNRLTPSEASCLVRHPYATLVLSSQTGESAGGSVCYVRHEVSFGRHARTWFYFDYQEPR